VNRASMRAGFLRNTERQSTEFNYKLSCSRCAEYKTRSSGSVLIGCGRSYPAQRQTMGLRGREYARTAFSWDRIGLLTAQFYDWVLGLTSSVPQFVFV
jgi:hypothetical protein